MTKTRFWHFCAQISQIVDKSNCAELWNHQEWQIECLRKPYTQEKLQNQSSAVRCNRVVLKDSWRPTCTIWPISPSAFPFTCLVFRLMSFSKTLLLWVYIRVTVLIFPLSAPPITFTLSPTFTCNFFTTGKLLGFTSFLSHRLICSTVPQVCTQVKGEVHWEYLTLLLHCTQHFRDCFLVASTTSQQCPKPRPPTLQIMRNLWIMKLHLNSVSPNWWRSFQPGVRKVWKRLLPPSWLCAAPHCERPGTHHNPSTPSLTCQVLFSPTRTLFSSRFFHEWFPNYKKIDYRSLDIVGPRYRRDRDEQEQAPVSQSRVSGMLFGKP